MNWNGENLKRIRESVSITQHSLSVLAQATDSQISAWERAKGNGGPSGPAVARIVAALDDLAINAGLPGVRVGDLYDRAE